MKWSFRDLTKRRALGSYLSGPYLRPGCAFERSRAVHTVVLTVDLSRCSHVLTVALVRCSYRCINTDSGEVFIRLNTDSSEVFIRFHPCCAIFVLTGYNVTVFTKTVRVGVSWTVRCAV